MKGVSKTPIPSYQAEGLHIAHLAGSQRAVNQGLYPFFIFLNESLTAVIKFPFPHGIADVGYWRG